MHFPEGDRMTVAFVKQRDRQKMGANTIRQIMTSALALVAVAGVAPLSWAQTDVPSSNTSGRTAGQAGATQSQPSQPTQSQGAFADAFAEKITEKPPFHPQWSVANAQALLAYIRGIGAEGLYPRDYQPAELAAAIAAGEGDALNQIATRLFTWLAEDLRDGRTPMTSRVQWFVVDPDMDLDPTSVVLERALTSGNIKGTLKALLPTHPDYAALKAQLAKTKDPKAAALIRVNMDRWRWLGRDLGIQYLMTNVPEYMLRLTVHNEIISTYRTVVGKPGKTATPQLAEMVENVVFNPTWTVPQSIVVGEGLGARLLRNPAAAAREGYAVKRLSDGMIVVVQQPGPNNSLGQLKIDMPNPHAIYLHDTPSKALFNTPNRAYSHGCIRTERAVELGMTMALLGADVTQEQVVQFATSGQYTKVPMARQFPVYITYFTMARDVNGTLRTFADIYGRDKAVLASFARPRELHTGQRKSNEPVVAIEDPGV